MDFSSYEKIVSAGNHGLYMLAVLVAGILGGILIRSDARSWQVTSAQKRNIFIACFTGSLIGCAIPAFFAGDFVSWQMERFLIGPKTIIGGLLFGFLFVAAYKRSANVIFDTSDAFARGGALMMAVGRLGCFAGHCCFGVVSPTFGMDFGDGVPRLPIQLIEAAFSFGLFFLLNALHRRNLFAHRRLFILFAAYGAIRFVLEFYRAPISTVSFGLNYYQWLALLLMTVGLYQIAKRKRKWTPRTLFVYEGLYEGLKERRLLGKPLEVFQREELARVRPTKLPVAWEITVGSDLIFNAEGLELLQSALENYEGAAGTVNFALHIDPITSAHYYSLRDHSEDRIVCLPVSATRGAGFTEEIVVDLPAEAHWIAYPDALTPATNVTIPAGLLIPFNGDFDLLFANQIAVLNDLRRRAAASPLAWIRSLAHLHMKGVKKRVALAYRDIHPTAQVHPTAVIEGSVIGPNVQIGAHCVVRYSHVAEGAKLHDGAKVEFSVVGPNTWLMHDLTLYRSVAEDHVFLIHGPYQFSYFQSRSAAFASILMDYRPDERPILANTNEGLKNYGGRFLGGVLKPGAKLLGGSHLGPGRTVAADTWVTAEPKEKKSHEPVRN